MSVSKATAAAETDAPATADLPRAGYAGAVATSFRHTLTLLRRRRWSVLGILVAFLPVLIPIVMVFFDAGPTMPRGAETFTALTEKLYLRVIVPLFALFFASMLIADDVENHTIVYILTRPVPRSATVIGRFVAYLFYVSVAIALSLGFTFGACTALGDFPASPGNFRLFAHYAAVLTAGLAAYGALSMSLGAYFSRRPVVYGIALLFGWQRIAIALPGVTDFITIEKYLVALLPPLATQRDNPRLQGVIAEFQKTEYIVGAGNALIVLAVLTVVFLAAAALILRTREYTPARAAGG